MLLAVDTNVLARALAYDGSDQSSRARQCFLENEIYVPDTVLLETEWVLRSVLKLPRELINTLFSNLLSSPKTIFADRQKIKAALVAHSDGLDFADALHLYSAPDCDALLTYDADFQRRAKRLPDVIEVREP